MPTRCWILASALFVVAGCGKTDDAERRAAAPAIDARSGPTDTELADVARRHVELLESLAAAATSTGGDCPAMSAKISEIVGANREHYDRVATLIEDDLTAKKLDVLTEASHDRSEAAMSILEPALTPCLDSDPALADLMDSILL